MELISIDEINKQYLKYETARGARRWLASKGINVVKIGRGYYIEKQDLENALTSMLGKDLNLLAKQKEQRKETSKKEQSIGLQLLHKITSPEL